MSDIKDTLKERGSRYGDFADNARVHQALLNVMMSEKGWHNLSDTQKSALDMFCQKQARILNGDPNYKDNWHDIAGYAKLAEDRCLEATVVIKDCTVETCRHGCTQGFNADIGKHILQGLTGDSHGK